MWQNVRAASAAYDTTLLCLTPPGQEATPLPSVFEQHGIRVIRVPHDPPRGAAAWEGLFGRWPYTLARYRSEEFSRVLRTLMKVREPAFAMVTPLHMATYADDLAGAPMILRQHNLEHAWMKRYADRLGPTPAGLYARIQARRLREAEIRLSRRAAMVLAIQPHEAEALRRLAPPVRVEVLPVGVDLDRFPHPHPGEPPVVLLAASFAWKPNVDGALQFLRKGWPCVTSRLPRARLRVVGKDAPRSLLRAVDRTGAEPIPYAESIEEEFARATVFVVPLWVGAGMRVKIVEAMAARVPVAATRLAADGLGITPGEHYAAGDTPEALGSQIATLLLTPDLRRVFIERGRAHAEANWSLDAVTGRQNALCSQVAR